MYLKGRETLLFLLLFLSILCKIEVRTQVEHIISTIIYFGALDSYERQPNK